MAVRRGVLVGVQVLVSLMDIAGVGQTVMRSVRLTWRPAARRRAGSLPPRSLSRAWGVGSRLGEDEDPVPAVGSSDVAGA